MSDLGGAILLSQQLSLYRTLDSFNQARDRNQVAANDAAWRNQYDNLVSKYNRLLHDANRLADVHDRELAEKDRQIAVLRASNSAQSMELEKSATELAAAKEAAKFLHGTIRELRGKPTAPFSRTTNTPFARRRHILASISTETHDASDPQLPPDPTSNCRLFQQPEHQVG